MAEQAEANSAIFGKDVLPEFGKRPIYEIQRPNLLEVIAKIERYKDFSILKKVLTWFRQMFWYALIIVLGGAAEPRVRFLCRGCADATRSPQSIPAHGYVGDADTLADKRAYQRAVSSGA